ncbi:MAG TPA: alpha/beta hydrolase-fold protein [Puia sp.]|jgi:S-formylglutathione hydrolase FrmB|nr:alpha/beta hydrolase-fold protein [Puia sp.]
MKKLTCLLLVVVLFGRTSFSQQFKVSYTTGAYSRTFSGRVLLYLNKENHSPKDAMVDMENFPCFSITVKSVMPGDLVVFDDKAVSFPVVLSDMEKGDYYVQAVWDRNQGGRAIAESPGNMFSLPVKIRLTKDTGAKFTLVCDQVVAARSFVPTTYVKELRVVSELLSRAQGRSVTVDAAVLLPREYFSQPQRKFPVLYNVSGYGGDYHRYSGDTAVSGMMLDTLSCITVYLDGNCPGGHSVYANSDNNGPWGDALVKEFIPAMENTYRCNGARLLWGHSSGGWTVLWLQTHYPKVFAGCWSSSPDPVDFRNFQRVNLYESDNIFYRPDSSEWVVATIAGRFPVATMKQCFQQENVIYRGEQMHSFNYVFSAKGVDGQPVPLCDPVTGDIDKKCVEHWKQYDISLYLRTKWVSLQKDLQGKVRVTVGNSDNFLLNYAVHMLDDEMKKLGGPFEFAYYPGDHFTVATPQWRSDGYKFLEDRYAIWKAGAH